MTKAEITKLWESGKICLMGKYLSGGTTEISVRDSKSPNGARRQALIARQVILLENDVVTVNEFLPDGIKASDWKSKAKNGDRVVVFIEAMELAAGTPSVTRGSVELIVG